jgi:hypothetical protein
LGVKEWDPSLRQPPLRMTEGTRSLALQAANASFLSAL